jgi:hypothetical protein
MGVFYLALVVLAGYANCMTSKEIAVRVIVADTR